MANYTEADVAECDHMSDLFCASAHCVYTISTHGRMNKAVALGMRPPIQV